MRRGKVFQCDLLLENRQVLIRAKEVDKLEERKKVLRETG